MDWGIVHSWINSITLGLVALIMIVFRRWAHLKWLAVYALIVSFLSIMYLLVPQFYGNYDFYVIRRFVGYLLFLGAAAEILRKDLNIVPWWVIPAILAIFLPAVLFPPYGWYYYLPRIILYIGVASTLHLAVKKRVVPLIALAVSSIGDIVSDGLKLISNVYQITMVQIYIDLWFNTAMSMILITGALWQEIIIVLRSIVTENDMWGLRFKECVKSTVKNDSAGCSHNNIVEDKIIPFPDEFKKSTDIDRISDLAFVEDIESTIERMADLESTFQAAAVLVSLSKKTFLSLNELAIYLGITGDIAKNYVEENNIEKIYLSKNRDHWLVLRSDVDENLKKECDKSHNAE